MNDQEIQHMTSVITNEEKAKLAAKAAHDEFMKTIPAGSRMRVTRDEKQTRKREYNKRPEVRERRRVYDQRPHVKLKRWLKNHNPTIVDKRKAYSARDDVKMRRYIVTQRRRQLANDCMKLLTEKQLHDDSGTTYYHVTDKRLVRGTPSGLTVIHKNKGSKAGWQEIPVGKETHLNTEMFDGNLHEKESSEVIQLIKEYYERASANALLPNPESAGGAATTNTGSGGDDSSSDSDDDDE